MATAKWVKLYSFNTSGTGMSLADIAFSNTGSGSPTAQALAITGTEADDGGAIANLIDNTLGTVAAYTAFGVSYVELVLEIDSADIGSTHIGIRPTACDDRNPSGFYMRVSEDGSNYGPEVYASSGACVAGNYDWQALPPLISEVWVRTTLCPNATDFIDLTEVQFDFSGVGATAIPVSATSVPDPTTGLVSTLYNNITAEAAVRFTGSAVVTFKCTNSFDMLTVPSAIRLEPYTPDTYFPYAGYLEYSTTGASGPWTHAGGFVDAVASNNLYVDPGVTFTTCPIPNGVAADSTASAGDAYVYDVVVSSENVEAAALVDTIAPAIGAHLAATAAGTDMLESATFTLYADAIGLSDAFASSTHTTALLSDRGVVVDVIRQAINQIVADSAVGTDSLSLGAALALVDIADAITTQTTTRSSTVLVAELIAALDAYNGADGYDVTETGALSDAYVARVSALVAQLESAQAVEADTVLVHVMQTASDSAEGTDSVTSAGSLITALLSDTALVTVRLNIGGELFTGWVLNTDTMAPSEYQFADRQFNSACKHGARYLMAAEDGIYEFTNDTGVESVMTYIKTGKTDFGSDLKKRIVNSYMVYSASGQMVLKVTTSEFGNLVTRNYRMTPQANDTTDARRIDIGKGVTSRYWQFEVVGDGVDCDIDEIGMLPVVLSRRI